MTAPDPRPADDLARVAEAEHRFLGAVAGMDDAAMGRATLLPEWSVAHLLTHVANNAESHLRRTRAAVDGIVVDQYPGGAEQRAAEIAAGARRDATAVLADLHASSTGLLAAWADVPTEAWVNVTRDLSGRLRPLLELPSRRWLELEVHLVDLGTGPTTDDWPEAFVSAFLPRLRVGAGDRLPAGARLPAPGTVAPRDELAWLLGRIRSEHLPTLGPWA